MRIGLCLLTLAPGRMGGSETYARELLRGLARVGKNRYTVLLPETVSVAAEGLTAVTAHGYRPQHGGLGRAAMRTRAAARSANLRRLLGDVDILHYPLTVPLPRSSGQRVVTLHDVLHVDHPELFRPADRLSRRITYDRAARAADRVIVLSAFARDRAIERLGLTPERVHVIPLGVDHDRFRPSPIDREPFLLYPARFWPHKNHALLFDAFARLRAGHPELRLVLTGGGHEGTTLPGGVESLGLVSDEELAQLYRRAACLVFPSLYEGFGLPPLEAMACGCPVAAAAAGAIPEVCGGAARLFDPRSVADLVAATDEVLAQPEPWQERGLKRAAGFTWDATARAHDAVFAELGPAGSRRARAF